MNSLRRIGLTMLVLALAASCSQLPQSSRTDEQMTSIREEYLAEPSRWDVQRLHQGRPRRQGDGKRRSPRVVGASQRAASRPGGQRRVLGVLREGRAVQQHSELRAGVRGKGAEPLERSTRTWARLWGRRRSARTSTGRSRRPSGWGLQEPAGGPRRKRSDVSGIALFRGLFRLAGPSAAGFVGFRWTKRPSLFAPGPSFLDFARSVFYSRLGSKLA